MYKPMPIGSLAVISAALLWSLDGLLRRELFVLPPTVIVFWEHLLGLIILLPITIVTWKNFRFIKKKQWLAIGLVSLLSGAIGTIFYTAALAKVNFIPLSVVVLLQQLQPIFAITAASILLKEPLTKKFIVLALLALIAAYGVAFPHLQVNLATGNGTVLAALLAIGAAIAWGTSTAFSKYSLKGVSSIHITTARFAFTPLFALLFTFLLNKQSALMGISSQQWIYLGAITLSTGMVALALYYFGLKKILASRSTILELTWPISSACIGFFILNEFLTATQWISSCILLGIIITIVRGENFQKTI